MRAVSLGVLLLGLGGTALVACDDVHSPQADAVVADGASELGTGDDADGVMDSAEDAASDSVEPDTDTGTDTGTATDTGTDTGTESDTATGDIGPSDDASPDLTRFQRDLKPLLDGCKGCHSGAVVEFELDLTDPWASVGVASKQSSLALLVAGSHLDSYLWHKVNGSQGIAGGAGGQMPLGLPWSAAEIQMLADWIDAGLPL